MSHFQPSYHSSIDYTRYNYDLAGINYDLGVADVGETASYKTCTRVQDVPGGWFTVCSDKTVLVEATGKSYSTDSDPGATMIKHLLDVSGNGAKIDRVLTPSGRMESVAASTIVITPQQMAESGGDVDKAVQKATPFHKQPWFWPAVIGVVGAGLVTGIVVYRRGQ